MPVFVRKLFFVAHLLLTAVPCGLTLHAQAEAADASNQERFSEQEKLLAGARREISTAPIAPFRFPDRWYPGASVLREVQGPLIGKPYRALQISNSDGVDPGGKPPVNKDGRTSKRDGAGRERSEQITGAVGVGETMYPLKDIRVTDPVAHCSFHWSELVPSAVQAEFGEKVAFVECLPRQVIYVDLDLFSLAYTHPSASAIILHGQMNGEGYIGLRYLGKAGEGNQAVPSGRETWYSTDLRLELASFELEGDPEHGGKRVQTLAVTGLERAEPDPSLFYPPENYRIELQPAGPATVNRPTLSIFSSQP